MKLFILLASVCLIACGCSTPVLLGSAEDASPSTPTAQSLQVEPVRFSKSVPRNATVVSDLEADYCHPTLDRRVEAEEIVMASLREGAYSLGADGVANIEMNTQHANAFLDPCWKQVTATGVAYKMAP